VVGNLIAGLLLFGAVLLGIALLRLQRRAQELRRALAAYQREHRAVIDFLVHTGDQLTARLELDETLEAILRFMVDSTDAHSGAVFLRDAKDPNSLQAHVIQGPFPPLNPVSDKVFSRHQYLAEHLKREKIRLGEGLVGRVAERKSPLLITDARNDPIVPAGAGGVVPIDTLMAAPLIARDELLGVIVLVNRRQEKQPFTPDDLNLLGALADQAAITVNLVKMYRELGEKQRLEQELRVAHDIQGMLLPRVCPAVDGLEIAAFGEAALEVGGDYYDFFDVDDVHLGIAIGDVAGKGIPGALVMASVRSTLRAEARGDLSPAAVLARVNRNLVHDTSPQVFVTMTYAILDRRTLRLRFARAGHEPIIVCSAREEELPVLHTPNGIALGLVDDQMFRITEEEEVELHEGELGVLYTDGVVEARNRADEEYGASRFLAILQSHANRSVQEIVDGVTSDIRKFTEGLAQHDDITLVVLKAVRRSEGVQAPDVSEALQAVKG